jgi:hypothetical protein
MSRLLSTLVVGALVMSAGCYESEYSLDRQYNRPTAFDGSSPSNVYPYYDPYPAPRKRERSFVARDSRFHDGQVRASNTSTSHAGVSGGGGGQR